MINHHQPNEKYGFSQFVTVSAGSDLAFISGQSGANEAGTYDPDFRTQLHQCLANLSEKIRQAGSDLHHVAKITVLVTDLDQVRHDILDETLKSTFPAGHYPASTLIPVARLSTLGMQIEIDAICGKITAQTPPPPAQS